MDASTYSKESVETVAPRLRTRKPRQKVEKDADDSSELSDASIDSSPEERPAQQIRFAKMPRRGKGVQSPLTREIRASEGSKMKEKDKADAYVPRRRRGTTTDEDASSEELSDEDAEPDERDDPSDDSAATSSENEAAQNRINKTPQKKKTVRSRPTRSRTLPIPPSHSHPTSSHSKRSTFASSRSSRSSIHPTIKSTVVASASAVSDSEDSEDSDDLSDLLPPMGPYDYPLDRPSPVRKVKQTPSVDADKPKMEKRPSYEKLDFKKLDISTYKQARRPSHGLLSIRPVKALPFAEFKSAAADGTVKELNIAATIMFPGLEPGHVIKMKIGAYKKINEALEDQNDTYIPPELRAENGYAHVTVRELVGFALYTYQKEQFKPDIPQRLLDTKYWQLHMMDDGVVDDDYEPLPHNKAATNYTLNQPQNARTRRNAIDEFMILPNSYRPASSRASDADISGRATPGAKPVTLHAFWYKGDQGLLHIATIETTTHATVRYVLDQICSRAGLSPLDFTIRLRGSTADLDSASLVRRFASTTNDLEIVPTPYGSFSLKARNMLYPELEGEKRKKESWQVKLAGRFGPFASLAREQTVIVEHDMITLLPKGIHSRPPPPSNPLGAGSNWAARAKGGQATLVELAFVDIVGVKPGGKDPSQVKVYVASEPKRAETSLEFAGRRLCLRAADATEAKEIVEAILDGKKAEADAEEARESARELARRAAGGGAEEEGAEERKGTSESTMRSIDEATYMEL